MAATRSMKYDTLLKPVHDNLLKDWGLSLSFFLVDFMNHLGATDKMNFSEAAMVLQNGTAFYCKRVDVVYKTIHEFVTEICTNFTEEAENPGSHKNSDGKKRRKNVRSLEMDDLQLLDFVASDHGVDAKINSLVFQGLPKQIVLCSSMKALRKSGTSVTVYQTSKAALGCKEEFRVAGKTYSDGTVNEDFNIDQERLISPVDETIDHGDDKSDDSFGGFDNFVDRHDESISIPENPVDGDIPPLENAEQPSSLVPGFSTLAVSASIPVAAERCAPVRAKIRKDYDWEPVSSDTRFPIKALKMGKSVYIPIVCLDEAMLKELEEVRVKAKKRKRKEKEGKEAVDGVKIRWIDEAIRIGSIHRSEVSILTEKEKRKKLPTIKHKLDDPAIHDDSAGLLDDPEHEDLDAFQDDNELISADPVNRFEAMIQEEDRHEYVDEALKAIEKFKETRRENASRQTDIAKRVAKWHEAIMPKLAKAEARSHLDVHEYGTKILDKFPDDDRDFILPFHELVKDEPANEICRYLLATLMLANTYNVEIIKRNTPLVNKQGMYCDYVELRLLTKVRHHEEMDEAMRLAREDCGT